MHYDTKLHPNDEQHNIHNIRDEFNISTITNVITSWRMFIVGGPSAGEPVCERINISRQAGRRLGSRAPLWNFRCPLYVAAAVSSQRENMPATFCGIAPWQLNIRLSRSNSTESTKYRRFQNLERRHFEINAKIKILFTSYMQATEENTVPKFRKTGLRTVGEEAFGVAQTDKQTDRHAKW